MYKATKLAAAIFAVGLLTVTQTQASWVVGYPWGLTHNGSAYMTHGGDVMTATQPGQNGYKYNSGASYSNNPLKCYGTKPTMGASAHCNVSATVRGVWPAYWLNNEGAYSSELDIAEWKGNGTCWMNTYDGSWESTGVTANNCDVKVQCTLINTASGNAVRCQYYINGSLRATHTCSNLRNKAMDLIRDLQMEGSSGSPGPTSARFTCSSTTSW